MYDRGVFIPACDEAEQLPGALESLSRLPYRTLLVLVLNNRVDAPESVKRNNRRTFDWLMSFPSKQEFENRYRIGLPDLDVLLIDHQSAGFELPPKQGVGRVRHVGASALVEAWRNKEISYPVLWSTDADARFPDDYLDRFTHKAGVYPLPYVHVEASESLMLYELSLRYYTLALHWAGSPYAYPTIGSSIAFHAETYLTTRGFPDRLAGEDFYWLNKARKVSQFLYPDKAPVMLIDRPSDRVPFGTGKGSADIAASNNRLELYAPTIFHHLREWLTVLDSAEDHELIQGLHEIFPEYDGYGRLAKVIAQPTSPERRRQRRHEFFDAFRTMRWVHQFRDLHHPNLPWKEALDLAPWMPTIREDLNRTCQLLLNHERTTLSGHTYPRALSMHHSS